MIELDGVVTEVRFVNPHAYVYFNVKGEGAGSVLWRCELSAATALQRRGWTAETPLHRGMQISINGSPARREDNVCFLNSFSTPDGVTVNRNGNLLELDLTDTPAFEVYADAAEGRPE